MQPVVELESFDTRNETGALFFFHFFPRQNLVTLSECCPKIDGEDAGRMTRSFNVGWIYYGV